ncbi:MAG: site-specific integrase [Solirubrobacteraceae bacterium]
MAGSIQKREYTRKNKAGKDVTRTVWRARYPDPTKPPGRGAKHEKTFATKHQAEEWLSEQTQAVRLGQHVAPRKGRTPLRDVAEAWKATWNVKPLSPKTQRDYESILANHILPRWGDAPIGSIASSDVEEWINGLTTSHGRRAHAETAHHVYCALRQIMKTALRHKLIATNPCSTEGVTLPSKKVARATAKPQLFLTVAEVRELVAALPPHWRTPVRVAAYCGLRAGELWALRRCDVVLNDIGAELHVVYALKDVWGELIVGPTKTHQRRKLTIPAPLVPDFKAALSAQPRPLRRIRAAAAHGYPCINQTPTPPVRGPVLDWTDDAGDDDRLLFTMPSGHPVRHLNFLRREWRKTVDALWPEGHRLHGLRFHDLRHTCASLSLAATGNLHVVKERLGHEDIKTTVNRYGGLLESVDVALADALGTMITDDENRADVVHLNAARNLAR